MTAFGRRRPLPDLLASNYQVRQAAERQAMNAGIQGLAADMFKLALVRLDAGLEEGKLGLRLVLQVHDEVIVEVAAGRGGRGGRPHRARPDRGGRPGGPAAVAMAWGSSWAEAKGA